MSTDENLNDWVQKFDILNYPIQVYQELVVEGKEHPDKLSIMGAWKTGSLRASADGNAYIDKLGKRYKFTNRWKSEAPVGYDNWQYISANQDLIKSKLPNQYEDKEPAIVNELKDRPGFGFIWTLFVLHCLDPNRYPLYDQHVYRAFNYLKANGIDKIDFAPNRWSEYSKYRQFFLEELSSKELPYWDLDRALWALGKSIKLKYKSKSRVQSDKIKQFIVPEEGWRWDLTLCEENEFWWKLDDQNSLHIMRQFKNAKYKEFIKITANQLNALYGYLKSHPGAGLGNSVSNDKEGLGKFMKREFGWNNTQHQVVSHIASIFVHAGIWDSNGKKKGILFWLKNNDDWQDILESYYFYSSDDSEE